MRKASKSLPFYGLFAFLMVSAQLAVAQPLQVPPSEESSEEVPPSEDSVPADMVPVPQTGPASVSETDPAQVPPAQAGVENPAQSAPGTPVPPPATTNAVTPADTGMEPKPEEISKEELFNTLILQGLNKVTAQIEEIKAPVGTVVRFGNLEVIARACWQAPPEARPENAALIEVWELKQGEQPTRIFAGWMFSSSPGLSALEHPVYDLTVIRCEKGGKAGVSE